MKQSLKRLKAQTHPKLPDLKWKIRAIKFKTKLQKKVKTYNQSIL